jgi:hypothetical protein
MTKAELLALAARVEAATGADRELDAEIVRRDAAISVLWWDSPPAYTASLDAAASLVPAGWSFEIRSTSAGRAWACAFTPGHFAGQCQGNPPALALTAAALRAMAEEAGE